MAGSLIKIDEEIVTSAVASVSLLGIDSTYDVYMVRINNITSDTGNIGSMSLRVTVSGTPDTSANYDIAMKNLRTSSTFVNEANQNITVYPFANQLTNATQSQSNAVLYLFNFNNSSEYSFGTSEATDWRYNGELYGRQGGFVNTVQQACDGIYIFSEAVTTNINSGTFTLYGLKK